MLSIETGRYLHCLASICIKSDTIVIIFLQVAERLLEEVVDLVFVGCHEDGFDAFEGGDPWGNGKRVAEQQKPLEGVPIL